MKDFIKTDAFKALIGCAILYVTAGVTWYLAGRGDGYDKGYNDGYKDGHEHRQNWYGQGFEDGVKYEMMINQIIHPEDCYDVEDLTK